MAKKRLRLKRAMMRNRAFHEAMRDVWSPPLPRDIRSVYLTIDLPIDRPLPGDIKSEWTVHHRDGTIEHIPFELPPDAIRALVESRA